MPHRIRELGCNPLASDRARKITTVVVEAVGSVALTVGSLVVGPVFSPGWNLVLKFGGIVLQLGASLWEETHSVLAERGHAVPEEVGQASALLPLTHMFGRHRATSTTPGAASASGGATAISFEPEYQ